MKIIELKEKLDELIKSGKGDLKIYYNDGASGLEEIISLEENYNTWDGNHIQLL